MAVALEQERLKALEMERDLLRDSLGAHALDGQALDAAAIQSAQRSESSAKGCSSACCTFREAEFGRSGDELTGAVGRIGVISFPEEPFSLAFASRWKYTEGSIRMQAAVPGTCATPDGAWANTSHSPTWKCSPGQERAPLRIWLSPARGGPGDPLSPTVLLPSASRRNAPGSAFHLRRKKEVGLCLRHTPGPSWW